MATASKLAVSTTASAMDMAEVIFGNGTTVISASISGAATQSGVYSGAMTSTPGVTNTDTGMILSTGKVGDFAPWNDGSSNTNRAADTTTQHSTSAKSDAQLESLAGGKIYDPVVFNATFVPDGNWITLQFVFSSEEYLEYVSSGYNDAFGVWVNGVYAPVSGLEGGVVAIDSVNSTKNSNVFKNNPANRDTWNTEMDGLTHVLSIKAPVTKGQPNTIKIGLADAGDAKYDSNVLIMGDSIQSEAIAFEDAVAMTVSTTRTIDVLHNDVDTTGEGLTITHINGQAVSPGGTVTLPSGDKVKLNADGTLTITNVGGIGTDVFTYTVLNSAGTTDTGFVTIKTVAAPALNGMVEGTTGDDVIDASYLGDPDGDRIDNNDAIGVGGTVGQADYVLAGAGNDRVHAGAGNDIVFGGTGNDTLHGDAGNDSLSGDEGDDHLFGGDGDDALVGGLGSDVMSGGAGSDQFVIENNDGNDTVFGGTDAGGGDVDVLDMTLVTKDTTVVFTEAGTGNTWNLGGSIVFTEIEEVNLGSGQDHVTAPGTAGGPIDVDGGLGSDELLVNGDPLNPNRVSLDDSMSGTLIPAKGGDPIAFGPGQPFLLSDILGSKGGKLTITGVNLAGQVGDISFSNFEKIVFDVICFVRGTLIKTDMGELPIETLAVGDRVLTLDNGYQEIRWIGATRREALGRLAPVRIRAGALGNDRDLLVSQQHRMLLRGWQASLMFGEAEVLVPAKSLINDHSILCQEGGEVEYYHMLFDQHEIVFAEGAPSESFHPGAQGLRSLDEAARAEILDLFPELAEGADGFGDTARRALRDFEGRVLAEAMLA